MNAIERLRELLEGEPTEPDIEWSEACADWLHENGAAVEALYQAAREVVASDGTGRKQIDALAAAVRRVEGEA